GALQAQAAPASRARVEEDAGLATIRYRSHARQGDTVKEDPDHARRRRSSLTTPPALASMAAGRTNPLSREEPRARPGQDRSRGREARRSRALPPGGQRKSAGGPRVAVRVTSRRPSLLFGTTALTDMELAYAESSRLIKS